MIHRIVKFGSALLLAASLLALGGAAPAAAQASTYTVQPGDTLWSVAQRMGISVATLVDLNDEAYPSLVTNPNRLLAGWVLQCPSTGCGGGGQGGAITLYTVQPGDRLYQISRATGVPVQTLIDLNVGTYPSLATNPDSIQPGWVLRLVPAPATYTVRAGDHLAEIARNNGTTVQALINLNVGTYPSLATNPNILYVGWVLRLR